MTTTITYGDTADGHIVSSSSSYSTAYNGGGSFSTVTNADIRWGQSFNGSNYFVTLAYISFAYTVPSNELIVSSYIRVVANGSSNTAFQRDIYWDEYDWGASLTSADWRTPTQLTALSNMARIVNASDSLIDYYAAGSDTLNTRLASSGTLRLVGSSSRLRALNTPGLEEDSIIYSADASGTTNDPALIFTSYPANSLYGVLGSQVQLSGGRHIFIESSTSDISASPVLKYHDTSSATTIATLSGLPACVDLDTKILTKRGWLGYDEVTNSDEARAIDSVTGKELWSPVIAVRRYDGLHYAYRLDGALGGLVATAQHRWLIQREDALTWVTTDELRDNDIVPNTSNGVPLNTNDLTNIRYDGLVWCPTTEAGTWLARRGDIEFFTGNKP